MKTNLLLNQSFGTVGSPNQTGETLSRENRIGLMSYLRRTLMLLFAVLVMSMANIGMAWGATFVEKWQNGKNESTKDLIATFTLGTNAAYNSSKIEIASGKTGSFTWAVPAGYTITSVKFLMNTNDSYVKTFTGANGTVTKTATKEWTYVPSAANSSSVVFSLEAQNSTVKIEKVYVTFTDGVSDATGDYESIYPVSADSSTPKNVSFTSSAAATSVTSLTTENGVNNQAVQVANGKKVIITTSKNIKYILFSWNKYAPSADAKWTANTGTYVKSTYKWTPANTTTKSVTFTRNESNTAEISNIHIVYYVSAAACGETAQAALTLSSNSGTICGTGTATFTVSGGSGTGELSVSSSDETKATASIEGSTVTVTGVAAGSATITVTKACDATYAEATADYSVTVNSVPTANAGADKTTELGEGVDLAATAAASGCTGAWTIVSGPNTATSQLSSTSSATATFTPTVAGTYTLRWTVTNSTSGCSAYDDMTVKAAVCSISSCGNATLTYAINASTDVTNTAANLISSATASNTTAMGINSTAALSTITIGSSDNAGKAAAATSTCYPTKPTMSSKIGMYNGSSYSSSNYLQFAFTVNSGYTFTPCDIQFTVQPVSNIGNFRWEVTDGTVVYGYGVATNVQKGSDGGASVLTGLTSTEEMEAGDYYIRLYPYYNGSNTFRISNNVILKGTTASAAPSTKRIYMKAGAWNTDSPYFYAHSWGSSNSDVLMTLASCESDVFYADIPSGNTSVLFTRQSTNSGIKYKDETGNYNQSADITISTNDKFTFSTWADGDGKSTFTGGTYSAPTYTISYAANSGSGSMSSQTGIACGTDKATTANAFTRDGYSFTGWKADVDVTVGGSTKTAGTLLDDGVTIEDISSNITLTAQWEAVKYTVTYNVNGGGSVTPTSATQASGGASVTLPTPTWSGYTFDGWYNAGKKIGNGGASYTPTADITLYAHWTDNISGKVFSFIDNNYGDKFKAFDLSGWVTSGESKKDKTYSNATTGVQLVIDNGTWENKSNAIAALVKLIGSGTDVSDIDVIIPTGKIATVKISYGAYGKGDDYRMTVNSTAQANPDNKLDNGDSNAEVISHMKEVTLNNQTGTLQLGISNTSKNNYIGRVSAVITGYVVTYDKGTYGTGTLAAGTKTHGSNFTLSSSDDSFTRDGYVYDGWSTNADGSTKDYNLGGTYSTDAAITLYPHWVEACSTPAAPTNFTAGSISATGATFTITDAADAASYDIYYSTSSSAPEASTPATTTSTSKTKEVTGLTAATTYYAWVRSVCDASNKSAWVELNPEGDTHTFATICVAPTTVNVTATVNEVSGYWFYPGDDVVLTAAPTGSPAGSPVTYQWKKNGADIDGATSSTYTINDAAASDAGKYTCTISYGECSTTSAEFSLKCMQFYLKNSSGEDISNHALQKVDATHATLALSLTGGTTYMFRVTDGCNDWYGNSDATGMTSSNCTNWTMPHDADAKMTTNSKSATYTFNFDFSVGLLGSEMKVSIVYPEGNQASGKVIYWDNNVLKWDAAWYRIGKGTHNNNTGMELVPGTANLYAVTTTEYNGFEYWHIANNQGEGTGNIFWTKDSDPATNEAITEAMGFEGSPVTADAVTITPTTSHATGTSSANDNCEFYTYGTMNGMKTDRVTISDYSNGTITVNYVDTDEEAASFTSGYADLAHTVILTSITAVANTGYDASAVTINGGSYSTNYVVTGATTIAASFTPQTYSITYKDQGGSDFSGEHASGYPTTHTYGSSTTLKTASKTGYTFGGWFTTSTCTGDAVASLGATAFTANITLYAKWTVNNYDLTWNLGGGTTTSTGTGIESGVSVNTTSSVAYGTSLTAPTVTKANYTFSAWSPAVASTMPAANTTYTATFTANQYSVTHSLTGVTTSSGATGSNAATYGTNYSATFAASSGYELPSSVTVTAGGSDITASCTYTKGTGTVVIPGASITGNIVITVTGVYADNFKMVADASAASDATLDLNEYISQGSKNCTTLTGGTAQYQGASGKTMKVNASNGSGTSQYYGWYFNSSGDKIVVTLSSHVLQVGSVISVEGYGANGNGITANTSTSLVNGTGAQQQWSASHTVVAGDTHLVGKNVITFDRYNSCRIFSITISNCQSGTMCVTPVLPSLTTPNQGCTTGDFAEWDASVTNSAAISAASGSQEVSYSWKNSSSVEVATTAAYTPTAAGTYTVTATVHSETLGYIDATATSSTLTASLYTATSIGTQPATSALADVNENFTLGTGMVATGEGDLSYQWYSYTSSGGAGEASIGSATSSTYTTSKAVAGTYYYKVKVTADCGTVASNMITVTVIDPCFKATNLVKNDSWSNVAVNGFIDAAKVEGTITGGTIKNTGSADLGSNSKSENAGLVMDGSSKEVTVTLSGTNHLVVGSVITLTASVSDGAKSGSSKTSGLVVGGYDCSPASKSSETAYDSFTQSYTVTAGSSLVNANSFTIALKSELNKTYLHAIYVSGCEDCSIINPSLTYSKTTIWMDDADKTATATLTGYYGTPTITYTSSDPTVVRVDNASTGAITALKRGTATITATIGATTYSATDYCGATATCEITVKDVSCGNVEIAGVTLTANNAGTPSGSLIDSYGVLCEGDADANGGYKIGKGTYYIYLTLSSGNYFQNGDKVKVFVTQLSSTGDPKGLYIYAGSTSADTQVAFKANGDMTANAEAELELSNVPENTSSITIHRNSGVQNPFIKYMKVNRYVCPDSKEFLPTGDNGNWNVTANWIGSTGRGASLPTISDRVVISKPVTVDINDAKAKDVLVNQYSGATGKITVSAGKALIIAEKLQKTTTGSNRVATATTDVIINSDRTSAGVGALIIGGETGSNKATVNFETKVKRESGTGNWINQFIGSPFSDLTPYVDYALQIYEFRPAGGGNKGFWNKLSSGDAMTPFWGYNVLYNDNNYLDVTWTGTLNASSNNVTKTGSNAVQTDNLFANSWVAPIHIAEFEEDDFTNFDPTIYIFNAGTPQQEEAAGGIGSGSTTASSAGTYAVLPIDAAPWVGMEVIPAMQAFFVKAEGASPTIKFDYSKLVYNPAVEDGVGIVPNRAPRRATAEEAPEVIRLRVAGENGWAENTYLLGREDFTEGYDRGWDGRYMEGEDTNPQLYAPTSDGNMAVNCVPQIDGTVLGFRKGNADSQYTFTFGYEGEEDYYLKDLKLNIETLIDGEHSYTFTAESGDNVARFMIVRRTPTITTGTAGIEAEASKARKIVYNDKVYIVRGGRIYSIDGAMVR